MQLQQTMKSSVYRQLSSTPILTNAEQGEREEKVLRRKRSSGQARLASSLSAIREIESGGFIPEHVRWRYQLSSLSRLRRWRSGLNPTVFNGQSHDPYNRYPHVASIATSADGALISIAGNSGRIEVHELLQNDTDTRRLSLVPEEKRLLLSGCTWASHKDNDYLLASFENRGDVWEFNLQTCREDRPCRIFRLFRSNENAASAQKSVTDLVAIDSNSMVAAIGIGCMRMMDVRIKGSKDSVVGNVETGMRYALVASQGFYLYSADAGEIAMFDRRVSSVATAGNLVKSFAKNGSSGRRSEIRRKRISSEGSFNFLRVLPDSAPGCVAYQTFDGTVGYSDLAIPEPAGVHVLEKDPKAYTINGPLGLDELGTFQRELERAWYLKNRRGDIIRSPLGQGWVMLAPLVSRPGVRLVRLRSDTEAESFDLLSDRYYSCVCAPDGTLDRLIFCDASNRVTVRQMDFNPLSANTDKESQ